MTPNNWRIIDVFDTNKYVLYKHKKGVFGQWIHKNTTESNLASEEVSLRKKYGPIERITFTFPNARKATLKKTNTIEILVTQKNNLKLYELLENFHCGYRLNDRERKYINLFIVYEALSNTHEIDLKAIRNSFTHSRKNLNQKNTVNALIHLFGDKKIDLSKYKHRKVFNQKYAELKKISSNLLANALLGKITLKPNFQDKYYTI